MWRFSAFIIAIRASISGPLRSATSSSVKAFRVIRSLVSERAPKPGIARRRTRQPWQRSPVRGVESRRSFLNVEIGKALVLSAVVRACMSLFNFAGLHPVGHC